MNEILLIEPYELLLHQYNTNRRVAVYSDKSVFYWGELANEKILKKIIYPAEIDQDTDIEKIKSKIDWMAPIWNRWIGEVDDYEIYRRVCQLYVISMVQALKLIKVRCAIFLTGVSHHVEYSLLETACQLAGVKQIYLYATLFGRNARLLPLVQDQSIEDRQALSVDLSQKDIHIDILSWRDNFMLGKPPIHNEKVYGRALNSSYAVFQLFKGTVRQILKRVLYPSNKDGSHFIDKRFDYNLLSHVKIIKKQKEALAYYSGRMVDHAFVDDAISREGELPILFAHYQPEATSFPEGGAFSNHVDIVLEIRRLGYRGTIFYKEHPGSWLYYSNITGLSRVGLYRSLEYYKQLEALGCVFINNAFKLQGQHILKLFPITITGTIGVERSLTGLSTCCAGEPWYKGAPGTYSIREAFGADGVFHDQSRWQFDGELGVSWFNNKLSYRTINNYFGIGTGVPSSSNSDKIEFLSEFDNLMGAL